MSPPLPDAPAREPSRLVRLQRKYRKRYDAASLLLYLLFVYAWAFYLPAMGRDYRYAQSPSEMSSPLSAWVFAMELEVFGAAPLPYHAVNLALLYGCMLLVYALTRLVYSEGPIWLATLAAALFMANPVHSDGVLPLSAVSDLLPAAASLGSLVLYVFGRRNERTWLQIAGWAAVVATVACFRSAIGLGLVLMVYEAVLAQGAQRRVGIAASLAAIAVGAFMHFRAIKSEVFDPAGAVAPLYFVLYPIGFLPENAQLFHAWPILGWLSAAVVVFLGVLVYRKARHRAILFGVFGAVLYRVFQSDGRIDPVHLSGGGELLVSTGLMSIGIVVVFGRMLAHPKWRPIIVSGTTLLALLLFILQIRAIQHWREAAREVERFQREARELSATLDGAPLGVLVDFQYSRGAPLLLSESIQFDTEFSEAVANVSLLRLHYDEELEVSVEEAKSNSVEVHIAHETINGFFPWPYALAFEDSAMVDENVEVSVLQRTDSSVHLRLESVSGELPPILIVVRD